MDEIKKQLENQNEILMIEKEKYFSNLLFSLVMPILIFLLGNIFTNIGLGYLIGLSLGSGLISSGINYFKYQFCRGSILHNLKYRLELDMNDNMDNIDEYFELISQEQTYLKSLMKEYFSIIKIDVLTTFFCFLIINLGLLSNSIFLKIFFLLFSVPGFFEFSDVMDSIREILKLNDEEVIRGLFLEENKDFKDMCNILKNVDIDELDIDSELYFIEKNNYRDDEIDVNNTPKINHDEGYSDNNNDKDIDFKEKNVKVRKLTKDNRK